MDTVNSALRKSGGITTKAVERWYTEMPREEEMLPKDKYTIFDRKEKKYRKGIHSTFIQESLNMPPISLSFVQGINKPLQSSRNGPESAKGSIHLVSRDTVLE